MTHSTISAYDVYDAAGATLELLLSVPDSRMMGDRTSLLCTHICKLVETTGSDTQFERSRALYQIAGIAEEASWYLDEAHA